MSLHGDDESDDDLGSDEELDAEQLAAVWRNPRFQKCMENFRRSVRLGEPAFALADAPLRDGAAVAVVRDHARRRREAFQHGEVAIPWAGYADREYQRREHGWCRTVARTGHRARSSR